MPKSARSARHGVEVRHFEQLSCSLMERHSRALTKEKIYSNVRWCMTTIVQHAEQAEVRFLDHSPRVLETHVSAEPHIKGCLSSF